MQKVPKHLKEGESKEVKGSKKLKNRVYIIKDMMAFA
jgi:hypothetical protein